MTNLNEINEAVKTLNRYNTKDKEFNVVRCYGHINLMYGNKDISLGNTKTELKHQIFTALKILDELKESV